MNIKTTISIGFQVIKFIFILSIFYFQVSCGHYNENSDEIVSSTTQNKKGQVLKQKFNNTEGTLELELNGKKIFLNRVPTGSGIKFVNEEYEYINWQGETILMKNAEVIFYHKE
jgi:hypothetical protein